MRRRSSRRRRLRGLCAWIGLPLVALLCLAVPAQAASTLRQAPSPGAKMSSCPAGLTSAGDTDFSIWACDDGADASVDESDALYAAESIYGPMTSLMGAPIADGAGSGGAGIDIYLLSTGQTLTRQHRTLSLSVTVTSCTQPPDGTLGYAMPDPTTEEGTGASGYIVLSRYLLDNCPADFLSVLVHEYFHILSFRYNTASSCPNFWFQEASAEWAEWYFAPATAATMVYPDFNTFQAKAEVSLTDSKDKSPYSDFVWPLYMQQQHTASSIASAWQAMTGLSGCQALNSAIDAQEAFAPNFDHFAVEDFDTELQGFDNPGVTAWPTDFGPMFQQLNPLTGAAPTFPQVQPTGTTVVLAPGATYPWTVTTQVKLPPLSARYDDYVVPGDTASVEFDFAGLTNKSDLGVSLIAADDGSSGAFLTLPSVGTDATICLAADDSLEGEFYVILDNHDGGAPATIKGSYTLTARTTCATSLSGTLHIEAHSHFSGAFTTDQTVTLKPTLTSTATGWTLAPPSSYSATYKETEPADCPGGTETTTGQGSGPMQASPPDLLLAAYEEPYTTPPLIASAVLGYETGTGTYSSPCSSGTTQVALGIAPVYCPSTADGIEGSYGTDDKLLAFHCSDEFAIGGIIYSDRISGTLRATKPMPCGLWTPGQADCSISGGAALDPPRLLDR